MGHPRVRTERYTADYLTWPEDTRYELIDGVAYALAPAPTRSHQLVVVELGRQIANALKGGACQTFVAPFDVRLPKAGEADASLDMVLQPDVRVVCDAAKLDERGVVAHRAGWRMCSRPPRPGATRRSSSPHMNARRYRKCGCCTPRIGCSPSIAWRTVAMGAQKSRKCGEAWRLVSCQK